MLTIRLQRIGKKKYATFRLIISEKARDTHDIYLENLGTYDPHLPKDQAFKPKADRIKYWLSKGATTSDTIHNLLVDAGMITEKKVKSVYLTKKRAIKVAEKKKAAAEAATATAPAA